MADKIDIKLIGIAETQAALRAVSQSLRAQDMRKVYLAAARIIRDQAKENAPKRTGLLRRSITTFASKTKFKERQAAITWAQIFRGTVRAPHAHLVEFGTQGRRQRKDGRLMHFRAQNGWVSARSVAPMPANHFFGRAVNSHGIRALEFALKETDLIIQNRWTAVRKVALGAA